MPLPWVRLDSNIASHDKILHLLSDPSPKRWQAASSYMFSLAWSGGQGTDGHIPTAALAFVHGTQQTARLLVKYRLWEEATAGFQIRNYDQRQELLIVSESKRAAQRAGALKGNCIRHHGPDCGCWRNGLTEVGP
jgi:FAD/FMN-containing dehydrogenase